MSSEDASNLTLGMVECKTDPECFGFKYIPAEVINKNAVSVRSCQVDAGDEATCEVDKVPKDVD